MSGISTLQAVLDQVQAAVQQYTDLEDTLGQLSKSRSLKRDREAQAAHIQEMIEHINAMDCQCTAEGHSVFGETGDAPVVSLPDGSSVSLRPNPIHPALKGVECQTHKDISAYLESMKTQMQEIHAWQSYLATQFDALVQRLPQGGDNAGTPAQSASPSDTRAIAQEVTDLLVDQLLTCDVPSLTHMRQLKTDRATALLKDPTASQPTPCHLAVKTHTLNVR